MGRNMDDKWTNEYAAMWDKDFIGELALRVGDEQRARTLVGMLYKRVGAKRAYPALKAALEAKGSAWGYAIRSVSQ